MLRRPILQLASRSSVQRVPIQITTQVPSYLSYRRAFSVTQNSEPHQPSSSGNAPNSQSSLPKIIAGSLALGSVLMVANYYGVLDRYLGKEQERPVKYDEAQNGDKNAHLGKEQERPVKYDEAQNGDKNAQELPDQSTSIQDSELKKTISETSLQESDISISNADNANKNIETHSEVSPAEHSITTERDSKFQAIDTVEPMQENIDRVQEKDLPSSPPVNMSSDDATNKPTEESFDMKSPEVKPDEEQHKAIEITPTLTSADKLAAENDIKTVALGDGTRKSSSLLDDYYLGNKDEESSTASSNKNKNVAAAIEDVSDGYISKDGKLVLDFLQAIHAAERRQAELDARSFAEEKRAMKEKYEKELKDTRARELFYAEREAILDKELDKERVKAAAALKSLQEKLEEKLETELEQKETEAELKLQQMQELAKAELAAAIASEKTSQIEKMAEANLNINALCMAFYARSEEARQSHSIHKLALGALALEDALSKGLPFQKEIEVLHSYLEGIDKDSLLDLVLSSLPEDTCKYGTDTVSQLNHKFDGLKGTLRHFSLIPQGGGGILSHSLAHVASLLKVKEADQSGDGIESLINRVESLLAQGKLCEAADALENGVKGSQAAEIVDDWVRRARDRAITEQALTVMQSYATSISLI
ncbi:Mitochondrial inner membrane protein Mitofilin [Forsythia ovata]|uniref:Mitochondrial inner membrane protein Mitofilin n=1 Tax=Forsythia ovata TaxID=205694 RepID=A0ABD1U996_9LAMI